MIVKASTHRVLVFLLEDSIVSGALNPNLALNQLVFRFTFTDSADGDYCKINTLQRNVDPTKPTSNHVYENKIILTRHIKTPCHVYTRQL